MHGCPEVGMQAAWLNLLACSCRHTNEDANHVACFRHKGFSRQIWAPFGKMFQSLHMTAASLHHMHKVARRRLNCPLLGARAAGPRQASIEAS